MTHAIYTSINARQYDNLFSMKLQIIQIVLRIIYTALGVPDVRIALVHPTHCSHQATDQRQKIL